jgi:dienelactone hydrolase
MRLFELCTVLFLFFTLLSKFIHPQKRWLWTRFIPVTGMLFLLLSVLTEELRWQMVLSFALMILVFLVNFGNTFDVQRLKKIRSSGRRIITLVSTSVGLIIFFISILPPLLFPVFKLPEPTGFYKVGTKYLYFVGKNRDEVFTEDSDDRREITLQIWYPANSVDLPRSGCYWENAVEKSRIFGKMNGLPFFILSHLGLVKANSIPDAGMAESGKPFPVLVFSHGYRMLHNQNTVLLEDLASHGYVVFAIAHAYDVPFVTGPDGTLKIYWNSQGLVEEMDEDLIKNTMAKLAAVSDLQKKENIYKKMIMNFTRTIKSVEERVKDIRFVIDKLKELDQNDALFKNKLDLERIGVFGMSFGGSAAALACFSDSRCKAGVNMDGLIIGDLFSSPWSFPFMFMTSEQSAKTVNGHLIDPFDEIFFMRSKISAYSIAIKGTTHLNFTDWSLFGPGLKLMGVLGEINGVRSLKIQNQYIRAFFDKHLQNKNPTFIKELQSMYPEVEANFKLL